MWASQHIQATGDSRFFLICLSHDNLVNHYNVNFILMQHHHYSLNEIGDMIPWERDVYLSLLKDHLKEEKEKADKRAMSHG